MSYQNNFNYHHISDFEERMNHTLSRSKEAVFGVEGWVHKFKEKKFANLKKRRNWYQKLYFTGIFPVIMQNSVQFCLITLSCGFF